jgi:hypothetical protein
MPEATHPPPDTVPGPDEPTSTSTGTGTGTGTERIEAEPDAERTDEPAFTNDPAFPDVDSDDG